MSQEGQGWVGWTERGRKMVGCFFFFFAFESVLASLLHTSWMLWHVHLEYCCLEKSPQDSRSMGGVA